VSGVRRRQAKRDVAVLLDEMHAPVVAQALRDRGHDVIAVAENPDLRAFTDDELFAWAADRGRRIVTENVKDYRRLLLRSEESGQHTAGLLLTSSHTFPRSRRNPGPLIEALDSWLRHSDVAKRPPDDRLRPSGGV
jgi:hypothetical protein